MKKLYRKLLSILVRRELREITNIYPYSIDELIDYHDFMAIETMKNPRILGISVQTAMYLSRLKKSRGEWES